MSWDKGSGVLPTTHRQMTASEYKQLPEGPPHFQLVDGELYMSPSPNFFHQEILGNLFALLHSFVRRHRLGKVIAAPSDVELTARDVYQPDIYFISNDRLEIVTEQGVEGAPDLVVEILSPGTARLDL